ncbi:hypothetical protein LTR62_002866 [Meristemomyces frigidus]|uniref:Midasin n=1 Tax=Meristemomyces frigidus TaxID=1508187 RepID=A0AAN7TXS3_9PEZI|nr:hypothetical protein LTR62_002866 [Meristemomyces frigidus]
MECYWDEALLERVAELPSELLQIIQNGTNEQYLEALMQASLDPRYTTLLLAHCEDIFAHICASIRSHSSLATSIATLGRIIPWAPFLAPFAIELLRTERYDFQSSRDSDEDLRYLLGLFRFLNHDPATFRPLVDYAQVQDLISCSSRPIIYLAIRILQICLNGADHWFEMTLKAHLGEDTPDGGLHGEWDGKTIDYRFLTLWEEQQDARTQALLDAVKLRTARHTNSSRSLPSSSFATNTVLVGNVLLPSERTTGHGKASALVMTITTSLNLNRITVALKSPQPLLISGLAGSGKTTLLRDVALKLGKADNMVTLHLNEQSDAKLLIGVYTTGDTPGSFLWRAGVLTTAVQEGRWVLIEDLDRAPTEIIGTLLPLIERGELLIPSRKQIIKAAPGFRIIATVRTTVNHRGIETQPLVHMLGARHWQHVVLEMPSFDEQAQMILQLYPSLSQLVPQMMATYQRLRSTRERADLIGRSKIGVLRAITLHDLLKWCSRVSTLLRRRTSFTSADLDAIYLEAVDCLVGALPDGQTHTTLIAAIAEELHVDPQRRDFLLTDRDVRHEVEKTRIILGRYSLPRMPSQRTPSNSTFSTNPHTRRMLERVAAAVINREPLLLVGETGVGKTTAVQHLASHLGKKLEPFNLSQQSEAGDLLGGFKPVTVRSLIVPMKDEFDDLFHTGFSISKNQQFLDLLAKQMSRSNWRAICKLWQQALKMVDQQRGVLPSSRESGAPSKRRKTDSTKVIDFARWDVFASNVHDLDRRLLAGDDTFAFSFVEGNIVKAVRNGDWVLLDEINLASPDTLESIVDLLDPTSPSLLLTEAGDIKRIQAHPDFRVFAAMNPATDVGKKDLPPGIRSRFTELYIESPDKDIKSLQSIVRSYLRSEAAADGAVSLDVSTVYQKILALGQQNKLVDGAGQKPHLSLRTLTRTLSYAKHIAPSCSLRRALYEGFQMSFLTFLDAESARSVQPLLEQHLFGKRVNIRAELQKSLRQPSDGHQYIQPYPGSKHWARTGKLALQEEPEYILTPFIRSNLENLVRASSTRQSPILIQGPTSSGKTSMIEYLAKRTGHEFVRINNHEHTDLQEYLGTYISGTDGRLHFQEGVLVKALRAGHWIVLDELNLAPTDVLEALNRLLDDNRELLVPETQETIRPHPDFMLFATQNPAGLYGGRKTLSRAFRNRFLELHFDDIPVDELQDILHRRTQLPESWCRRIVSVYREMSILRQENRLFEQKSFVTLRDLFRWALRQNDTIEQLAANGFMLLAERVRKPEEREALKAVIEKVMSANGPRVRVLEADLYALEGPVIRSHSAEAESHGVVWTKAMRRLYVLVSSAIANNEPVLLVGETGCGKTTICQMLAEASRQQLHMVNAHQNTETGDLIGSQRPVRNRSGVESALRDELLSSPILRDNATDTTSPTDELLAAYDAALSALSAMEKEAFVLVESSATINRLRTRQKALFEWVDGSLVQAMKEGSLFLLDEISLADDSVLERINSVLEPSRSILLAEKGSLDSSVTATVGFQFFATMNPGGDYGKRELSPALRNRFTEVWVPSLSDSEDILQIVTAKLVLTATAHSAAMVAFAQWFKQRYNTSANLSISVRDILAWVEFVNIHASADSVAAIVHGAAMVYIDTLGANPAGLMTSTTIDLDDERTVCLIELGRLLAIDAAAIYAIPAQVSQDDEMLTIGSFRITKRGSDHTNQYAFTFDAQTTRTNAMRVLRAMQLSKPIMLEGSPGVGKTALVTAVAAAAGVPLTRINLSEQTDLLDLFGSDAPVEGAATGTFMWRDAPFLRAMKTGDWVLLDEMNLASQSVLEGLNACLDHRGEVFVPELGQTFTKHPSFRLFAAQNPHHQGGGRKGLPASFVNRFTVVYADAFRSDDLLLICRKSFPQVEEHLLKQVVRFVDSLYRETALRRTFGTSGAPWEFNLRDTLRWLDLLTSNKGLSRAGSTTDCLRVIFQQRFRSATDRLAIDTLARSIFGERPPPSDLFSSVSTSHLQLGLALLPRGLIQCGPATAVPRINLHATDLRVLESAMLCVQQAWPIILTGPSGSGKTAFIHGIARTVGASIVTLAMNAETDAADLIGGYEQCDPLRQGIQALSELELVLSKHILCDFQEGRRDPEAISLLARIQADPYDILAHQFGFPSTVRSVLGNYNVTRLMAALDAASSPVSKANFEWTDGLLIEALEQGKWLILDNANLCSSSVLDRLNALLEPNGVLTVNEHALPDGTPRTITTHPSFRIFLTVDPRFGELSRAMRNRAVELYILPSAPASSDSAYLQPLQPESSVARFRNLKCLGSLNDAENSRELARIVVDHTSPRDQYLLSRLQRQLQIGLYTPVDLDASIAASSQEGVAALTDYYRSTLSRIEASADLACVQVSLFVPLVSIAVADGKALSQTLHPLNNQPLIQQDAHTLLQASTLAFKHDLGVEMSSLIARMSTLKSSQSLVRQLERAERATIQKHNATGEGLLSVGQSFLNLISEFLQKWNIARACDLGLAKSTLVLISAYWHFLWTSVGRGEEVAPLLRPWLSGLREALSKVKNNNGYILHDLTVQLSRKLDNIDVVDNGIAGSAMLTIWKAFKPRMPPTIERLNTRLGFEKIVADFDIASRQFGGSIADLARMRLAFLRALQAIQYEDVPTSGLTATLRDLLPGIEDVADDEGTRIRTPHFTSTFRSISKTFRLLASTQVQVTPESLSEVDLLALRDTATSSMAGLEQVNPRAPAGELHLLREVMSDLDISSSSSNSIPVSVMRRARATSEIQLQDLPLLEQEMRVLGQVLGTNAHVLVCDWAKALDDNLRSLTRALLTALAAQQGSLQAFSSSLLTQLEGEQSRSSVSVSVPDLQHHDIDTSLQNALTRAVEHLLNSHGLHGNHATSAARAWKDFGMASLVLYMSPTAFDPLLQPLIERDVHTFARNTVTRQITALDNFRRCLAGEDGVLRSRMLNEEMNALGPEPYVEKICRPLVSEVFQLHRELDGVMRAVAPLLQEESSDAVVWDNIGRLQPRLTTHFRAYSDITGPVVGFIDCLNVSRYLNMHAASETSATTTRSLTRIALLCDVTIADWISGGAFLDMLCQTLSQQDTLFALSSLACRCTIINIGHATEDLSQAVHRQFYRFYDQWRIQLSDEQKRSAAKSSLYRYQGELLDEDAAVVEELEDLFPSSSGEAQVAHSAKSAAQSIAPEIARLHAAIFRPTKPLEIDTILDLLCKLADLHAARDDDSGSTSHIPAMFAALHALGSELSQNSTKSISYNMYTDTNLAEVKKVAVVLTRVQKRFTELHRAWPEHATPIEVVRLCIQIYERPYSESLTKFLPMLEKLHATVDQWQQIASSEYAVEDCLEELISLIVSWRQLELSSWAGLLDREDQACRKNAVTWWFVAYESIIASAEADREDPKKMQAHAETLLHTLEAFMTSCGIGEFAPRLEMLQNFEAHISLLARFHGAWEIVRNALRNFNTYFSRFEQSIGKRLSTGRAKLEKDLRDIIKLASWKDRNVNTLRQSASSSHKKLLRHVRKYRILLAQPVGTLSADQMSAVNALVEDAAVLFPSAKTMGESQPVDNLLWAKRPPRFRNVDATRALMVSKTATLANQDVSTKLAAYRVDIKEEISSLQKETPPILTPETKDVVQDLKRRKRRLLADVIRGVQSMGFAKNIGDDTLARQASRPMIFASIPAFDGGKQLAPVNDAERTLHGLLSMLPDVRESARKHSEDLTSAESQRCMGLLESMLHTVLKRRAHLHRHVLLSNQLQDVMRQYNALTASESPTIVNTPELVGISSAEVRVASIMLRSCCKLLDIQAQMARAEALSITEPLREQADMLDGLNAEIIKHNCLPRGIRSAAQLGFDQRYAAAISQVRTTVESCTEARPQTAPLLEQLRRWMDAPLESVVCANEFDEMGLEVHLSSLLSIGDATLAAIEAAESVRQPGQDINDDKAWLVRYQVARADVAKSFAMSTVMTKLAENLGQLPHLSTGALQAAVAACRVMQPIFEIYTVTGSRVVDVEAREYCEIVKLAHQLAISFQQLAQRGFCTPSEKAASKDEKPGDLEAGTGLGDGDGAEDISKNIEDDEDLSELAQEPQANGKKEDVEDEQDAVDMADQEMEGDLQEQPEQSENGEDGAEEPDDAHEGIEEETGSVDDNGPTAMDEKMWDEGPTDDRAEKETEAAKGSSTEDDTAGAEDTKDNQSKSDDKEEDQGAGADAPPDEDERVQQDDMEQLDPHVGEEQNLELPDDLMVDGKDAEDVLSDSDGMNEDVGDDSNLQEDVNQDNDDQENAMELDETEDQANGTQEDAEDDKTAKDTEDDKTAKDTEDDETGQEAGDEASMDDNALSDVLMREEKDAMRADEDVVGETGDGGDAEPSDAQSNDVANPSQADAAGEGVEQREEDDSAASGQQRSSKMQDSGAGADDLQQDESRLPYKKVGDVLEEWYKQHHQIEDAQQEDSREEQASNDVDMANASFEHLPNEDATADTQALGAASVEQSTALEEDAGLPVNEEKLDSAPFDERSESNEEVKMENNSATIDPADALQRDERSKAFVGEPQKNLMDMDVDMPDDLEMREEDNVADMHQQLSDTHLDCEGLVDALSLDEARELWAEHEANTRNLALVLTEHLRLVLQPTQATKMRGDFRTGKRLNIKRIIPYIASSYKRDKIWMRRSVPSKRSYQIMLAIDDSKSMAESDSRQLAFETVALVAKAMSMLEVGELSIISFGENVRVAHDFSTPFTTEAGAQVYRQFTFSQTRTNVRRLLAESIELFRNARLKASGSSSELWQLQLIISDGVCEDHPSVRQLVRQAHDERIMVVFIVVDAAAQKAEAAGGPKQSILDLQTAEFVKDQAGEMQLNMVKYLETFPFSYYLIVRDVQELPGVLAGALRQWFAEVTEVA